MTRFWARCHPQTQCKWTQPTVRVNQQYERSLRLPARSRLVQGPPPLGSHCLRGALNWCARHEYVNIQPARPESNYENSGLRHPRRQGGSITHQPATKPRLASVVASAIRPTGVYDKLIAFLSSRGCPCLLDAQDVHRRLRGQVLKLATPGWGCRVHTLAVTTSTTICAPGTAARPRFGSCRASSR